MDAVARQRVAWPDARKFAFTIFDDTDRSSVAGVKPVYDFLAACGLRTTKTVWTLAPERPMPLGGQTLADPAYRDFVLDLKARGFEIAFHNATSHESPRERTQEALERFREVVGYRPRVHANHHNNRENIYWGADRFRGWLSRSVYRMATFRKDRKFEGQDPQSPYFWGDLCREHVQYVRNFVFREPNLLNVNPTLPYHDPRKPYVNFWFSSTDAAGVRQFCDAIAPPVQERLEQEGGVCILYTHLAFDFAREGVLDAGFRRLVEMLAARNGWFVPVGELLDHLRNCGSGAEIPPGELAAMERRWVADKIRSWAG
jgi:hypothetical protein